MAERSDIAFVWNDYSTGGPREITVDSPSEVLTCQDLLDTVRAEESKLLNLCYKPLLTNDTGGKAVVNVEDTTDLNLELFNALVGGEAEAGPGFTPLNITKGTIAAKDSGGNPIVSPILTTAFRQVNYAASRSGVIVGENVAGDVWGAQVSSNQVVGSFGEWVQNFLLTVTKFISLK